MGRISLDDLEKYGNSGGSFGYFTLKNDKDVAQVRIMLDRPEDIENYIFAVHEVYVGDDKYPKQVNCLRESYNSPVDDCPFCAAQKKVVPKVYIPLYNIDDDEVQIWTRGKGFMPTLTSFMNRYAKKSSLVEHVVEIERNGKAGDQRTTYQLYEVDQDETTLDDLPEVPDMIGTAIMNKSSEDMEYYLEHKDFPDDSNDTEEAPVRRRSRDENTSTRRSRSEEPEDNVEEEDVPFEEEEEAPRRRTPSRRGGSNRREHF